jgi:hypothetical protein
LKDPLESDVRKARAEQPPELRDRSCRVCGPFMLSCCPAAPQHDLRSHPAGRDRPIMKEPSEMTRRYIANAFLSPDVIDASIDEVHALAKDDGQCIALAGGIAMQIYGSTRLTGDVDVIAESPIPGVIAEGPLALIPGYAGRLPNGVGIDVIVPEPENEWFDLFEHALRNAVPLAAGGIPIVVREDLVVMKMMAGREDKDIPDLHYLLSDERTNLPLARLIVRELLGKYAGKEFDQLVEEARWRKSRK